MNQPPKTDYKVSKKLFLPLLLLLLFPFGKLWAQGCDCGDCSGPIEILSTTQYEIPISGAINNDLSNSNQGVCGVFIDISFEHIWSLTITLTSPSGQTITLMGPYDNFPGTTGGSNWDISFLPCAGPVMPDVFPITYNDQWTNLQQWAFFVNYTGSYYPYQGCLEDFTGSVNGLWTLTVTNGSSIYDTGSLNGFSILFCDPTGTGCVDCDADAGDLAAVTDIDLCEGENFNGNIDPSYSAGDEPSNQYSYTYIISQSSIIQNYIPNPDFSTFPVGNYEVCGLSYLTSDASSIPQPDGSLSVSDLENLLNTSAPFCGDISDDCFLLDIYSTPDTIFINDNFCRNEGYDFQGNTYNESGVYYATISAMTGCDTTVELTLTELLSTSENIAMTICQGDTFFIENNFYTTAGDYIATLQNIYDCDSIINLELDVLNPESIIAMPPMITCNNLEISINGGGSTAGSGVSYLWTTNGGNITGSTTSSSTMVDAAGLYYLSVTIDQNGVVCTDIDSVQVSANSGSLPLVNAGLDSTLNCDVSSIILQGAGSTGAEFSYEWTTVDGNIVSDTFSLNPLIDAQGNYVLTVTNNNTNCTAQDSVFINQNIVPPNVSAGQNMEINCENPTVELDGTGSSTGNNFIYQWVTSDGNILMGNDSVIAMVDSSGTYELTVTDTSNQCSAVDFVDVTIDTVPPIVDAGMDITLNCSFPETQIDATNSSQGIEFSYQWNVLSGTPLVDGQNTLTPTVDGAGTYQLVVTNDVNGCYSDSQVTVNQDVTLPVVMVETPVDTITCLNPTIEINAQNSSNGTDFQYEWTIAGSGNMVSGENSLLLEVDESGMYQLEITNTLTGCTQAEIIEVFSNNTFPNANAGVDMLIDCNQPEVSLDGSGSIGNQFEYLWTASNGGHILMGENTLNPTVDSSGDYQLQVTNMQNGCTQTDFVSVTVDTILPIADAGIDTLLNCINPEVILDGSNSSIGDFSYLWSTTNGTPPANEMTLQPTISTAGDYELLVTNNQNGCIAIDSIFVGENFDSPIAIAGQDTFITCLNPTIFLDGTGSSEGVGFTYQWTTSTGNILSGQTSLQPEISSEGIYELTVTNSVNGCTMMDEVIVTSDNNLPNADAGLPDSITCNQSVINLDGTLSSSGTGINYLWTTSGGNILNGENTTQPQVDSGGLYLLTVNNSTTGCSAQSSVLIFYDSLPPIANSGVDTFLTCENNSIQLDGSGSSIGANYNYEWTTIGTSTITNPNSLTPEIDDEGTFQLEVTNTQNGCFSIDEVIVNWDSIPPLADTGQNETLDCEIENVTLGGNSSIGTNFEYQWTFSAGGNIVSDPLNINITVNEPATYYLMVTNNLNGCTAMDEVIVSENIIPPLVAAIPLDTIPCDTQSITLDGTGSSSGSQFSYLWTTSNSSIIINENTLFPIVNTAGFYTLTVTNNDNHCESDTIVEVLLEDCAPIVNAGADGLIDCNQTTINLDGTGSSVGIEFSYLWTTQDGSIVSGENTLTPLIDSAGTYVLTVENTIIGLATTDTVLVISQVDLPSVVLSVNELLGCVNTSVLVSGVGSSVGVNYTYSWTTSNGNISSNISEDVIEVNMAGIYFLEIINTNNNCVAIDSIEVFQDNSVPIAEAGVDLELNCYNPQNNLDGSGSSSGNNYSYLWTTPNGNIISGEQTLTPEIDSSGIYFLQITDDSNGCSSQDSAVALENFINPTVSIEQPEIINCVDSILILNGGNSSVGSNFEYTWTTADGNILSGGNTLAPEINLIGNYQLEVFNNLNGCSDSMTVFVDGNLISPNADAGADDNIDCGVASIILDGTNSSMTGNLAYTWTTSGGNILNNNNTLTPEISSAGTYTLTIENNDNGCSTFDEVVITSSSCNPISIIIFPDSLTCSQTEVTLDGSTSSSWTSIIYEWTTSNGNIVGSIDSSFATVNQPGNYTLTIIDTLTNNISFASVIVGVSNDFPIANAGEADTLNCSVSSLSLNGSSSILGNNINYEWTTIDGNIISGDQTLTPLIDSSGIYFLQITNNSNGCTSQDSVIVFENFEIPNVSIEAAGTITCTDSILTLDGGNSSLGNNFEYTWTTADGNIFSGENTLTPEINLGGNYQLEIFNNVNGCSDSLTIFVNENLTTPTADAGVDLNIDCGVSSIILNGTNSSTTGNLSYLWTSSDGALINNNNTLTAEVSSTGIYVLTVENDDNGCSASDQVVVTSSNCNPISAIIFLDTLTCETTEITLDGSTSSSWTSIIYQWTTTSGNIISTTDSTFAIVNQPGNYTLTITDTLTNSIAFSTVTIIQSNDFPIAEAGEADTLNCLVNQLNLDGTNSSNGSEIIYQWTTSTGNIVDGADGISPLIDMTGTYNLLVTNTSNGCTATDSVSIEIDTILPLAQAGNSMSLTCEDTLLFLNGNGSSEGAIFTYNWNTSDGNILMGNETLNPQINASGDYTLTVQNSNNFCEATAQVFIDEDMVLPNVLIEPVADLNCELTTLQLDASNSSIGNNFSFEWQTLDGNILTGNQSMTPQIDEGGEYSLTILNTQNGCSNSALITVLQDTISPISNAGISMELTCADSILTLDGNGSSTGNEFSYQWNSPNGNILNGVNSLFPEINFPGNYELIVTNNNNMCTSESMTEITQDITAPVVMIEEPITLNCLVENISLDANNSSNGLIFSYLWNTNDGDINFGENTLAPQVSDGGTYELTILNSENGCANSAVVEVFQDTIAPIAEAGGALTLTCVDTVFNLDGSNSSIGNEFSYEWSTMDGNIISNTNSLQPLINETGNYQLQILNNNNQCIASDSVEVFESLDAPIVEIDAIGGLVLNCNVSSIVLDANGSSPIGNLDFEWTTSNGNILSGANNSNPEIDLLGEYFLTITNSFNGCTSTEMIEIFDDFEAPEITILSAEILTCKDTILTLDGTGSSEGNLFEYLWTTSNGNILSGANNLTCEIDAPGTYVLTILNTQNGCSISESVIVFQDINSPIADAGGNYEFDCIQTEITLQGTASQGNEFSYLWTTSDGNIISGASSLQPTIDEFGNYTLTVINQINGCVAVSETVVTEDLDQPIALEFIANPPLCFGDFNGNIEITNVIGGESPYLYSFNNQVFSQYLFFENLPAGDYPITVQDASGCEFSMTISLVDPPEVMVELGENIEIELGATTTLQAINNIPNSELDSVVWNASSHEIECDDCLEQEVSPLVSTNYSVWLMNENGCITEDDIIVYVNNERNIFIPNIFSPNDDGVNDLFMIYGGLGVEEVETFQIFSRWGELVFSKNNFQPNDSSMGWDGYFKGKKMNPAVFVFFAKIKYLNGETEIIKGDLVLK